MKSTFFFKVTLITLLSSLWACTETPGPRDPDRGIGDNLSFFEIDSTDAIEYAENYVDYIDAVKDTLNSEESNPQMDNGRLLTYGAKVDLKELAEILWRAERADSLFDEKNELYLMMGIIPSKSEPSIDSTELIFSLKNIEENTWRYFDFTIPCPNACPDWLVED